MTQQSRNFVPGMVRRPSRFKDLKNLTSIVLLAVAMLAAVGCGGEAAPLANRAAQQGEDIFGRVCATCHGRDANGLPGLGQGLRDNGFTASRSDQELVDFLNTGRPATHPLNTTGVDMPPKGGDPTITEEDLATVVAYLRTL